MAKDLILAIYDLSSNIDGIDDNDVDDVEGLPCPRFNEKYLSFYNHTKFDKYYESFKDREEKEQNTIKLVDQCDESFQVEEPKTIKLPHHLPMQNKSKKVHA